MALSGNIHYTKGVNGANLGFEEKLWLAADKMRGHVETAEYKHIVLGLIFLKYISDRFYEHYRKLASQPDADLENCREYTASGIFWVPEEARWLNIEVNGHRSDLAALIDSAMVAIEEANPPLKGVLPRSYSRVAFSNQRLGELINLIGTINLGDRESRAQDILGRVYEYFIGRFAHMESKGGEFYTPPSVVTLLVEMIEPYAGTVYDPCCGSGGMFVQSEKFVLAHGGKMDDLSIYGQELNPTTWRLCKMNLALRGIDGDIGTHSADSFHNDLHPQLKADFILANPPFNISDWGGEHLRSDKRWRYGVPPIGNANFAWIQHIVHHLNSSGVAAFILTNGSLSSGQDKLDGGIRKALIEADLVDCIVALPTNLFYNTQIAACIWIIARDKQEARFRKRSGKTLFIHARHSGQMIDRVHCELTNADIALIADTYHSWRNKDGMNSYKDIPGFCKSATLDEIRQHKWALVPGRYVGFDTGLSCQIDNHYLYMEIEQIEERMKEITRVSGSALSVLKELLYG
jgi:type I restriction enzyme M protein